MRLFMVALVLAGVVSGQTPPAEAKPEVKSSTAQAAIIPVKTLSGDAFNRLADMLGVFGVKYRADAQLRTILVYADPDVVAQIRKVVAELDRPGSEAAIGRNVEMTMTFLRCSTKPLPESVPLPADMEGAARQLRAATQYKHIELWDTVPLRLQEGKETVHDMRLPGSGNMPATATIRILPDAVMTKDSGRYVRFVSLNILFRIPYTTGTPTAMMHNIMEMRLNTAGDFKEGQKTILGKLSSTEDETATFVVISLKVLD